VRAIKLSRRASKKLDNLLETLILKRVKNEVQKQKDMNKGAICKPKVSG
jgi:hypothetical protein